MKRYLGTVIFFTSSIFLSLINFTLSAQQRAPVDFIEQQRNNAKKEITYLRTIQDINLVRAFIENWQNQDYFNAHVIRAYIKQIQRDFAPFIKLFNQEVGQQMALSQEAQELADALADDQGRLFTEKLAQLINEHGTPLLFAAAFTDENNDHLRAFFDAAIQENAIFSAVPGQAVQEIAVLHLIAHLVKHQQRRLDDDFQEDYSYFEPIARVIERGRADLVSLLLHSGLLRFFLEKEDHNLLVKMLNVALINQQPEIVNLLLQEPGINCNNTRILARLKEATSEADIHPYRFNQEEIIDINIEVPLILAIKYYTYPQGQRCLEALLRCPHILINQEDFDGRSALLFAIEDNKNFALQSLLATQFFDHESAYNSNLHLIHQACSHGNIEGLQMLLKFYYKKAEQLSKMTSNQTASSFMSKILNAQDEWGNTPLMIAIKEGHFDCVARLISHPQVVINKINNAAETTAILAAQNVAGLVGDAQLNDQEALEEFDKKLKIFEYIIDSVIGFQKKSDLFLKNILTKDNHGNHFFNYLEGSDYLYKKYLLLFLSPEECEIMLLINRAKNGNVESFIQLYDLINEKNPLLMTLEQKGFFTDVTKVDHFFDLASLSRETFDEELLFLALTSNKTELLAFVLHKCGFEDKICSDEDYQGKTVLTKLIELAIRFESISCIKVIFDHVKESFADSEIEKITNCLLYAAVQNKPAVMNYIFDYFEEQKIHNGVVQLFKNSLQRNLTGDSLLPYLNDDQLDKVFEMTELGLFKDENDVNVSVYDLTCRAVYECLRARVSDGDTDYLEKFLIFSHDGDLFDYTDETGYHYQKNDLFYDLVLAAAKTGQDNLLTKVLELLPKSYSINHNKKGKPLLIQFFEYIHAQVAQGAHIEQWLPVVRTLLRVPGIIILKNPTLLIYLLTQPGQNELFREMLVILPANSLNDSLGGMYNKVTLLIFAVCMCEKFQARKEDVLARLQMLLDLPSIDINKRITLNDGRVVTALSFAKDAECRALLLRYGAQE